MISAAQAVLMITIAAVSTLAFYELAEMAEHYYGAGDLVSYVIGGASLGGLLWLCFRKPGEF